MTEEVISNSLDSFDYTPFDKAQDKQDKYARDKRYSVSGEQTDGRWRIADGGKVN